jgi:polyhydroxyalkanoate synthesis regulator phasin
MGKRRGTTFTRFLEDIVDDTKEFVDDLIDRAKDVEENAKDSVVDVVDDDDDDDEADAATLQKTLEELRAKVSELEALQKSGSK